MPEGTCLSLFFMKDVLIATQSLKGVTFMTQDILKIQVLKAIQDILGIQVLNASISG